MFLHVFFLGWQRHFFLLWQRLFIDAVYSGNCALSKNQNFKQINLKINKNVFVFLAKFPEFNKSLGGKRKIVIFAFQKRICLLVLPASKSSKTGRLDLLLPLQIYSSLTQVCFSMPKVTIKLILREDQQIQLQFINISFNY